MQPELAKQPRKVPEGNEQQLHCTQPLSAPFPELPRALGATSKQQADMGRSSVRLVPVGHCSMPLAPGPSAHLHWVSGEQAEVGCGGHGEDMALRAATSWGGVWKMWQHDCLY